MNNHETKHVREPWATSAAGRAGLVPVGMNKQETKHVHRAESNGLAWVTLDRAAELMPGPESHRVLGKIGRFLEGRSRGC